MSGPFSGALKVARSGRRFARDSNAPHDAHAPDVFLLAEGDMTGTNRVSRVRHTGAKERISHFSDLGAARSSQYPERPTEHQERQLKTGRQT